MIESKLIVRRFSAMLDMLCRGRFVEKCDEHLEDALRALEAQPEGKGIVTLTVTIRIAADSGRVEITPAIKSKLPEEKSFAGTPFWTKDGGLSVQHPSQFDMFSGPQRADNGIDKDAAANRI